MHEYQVTWARFRVSWGVSGPRFYDATCSRASIGRLGRPIDQPADSGTSNFAAYEGWGKCRPVNRPPMPVILHQGGGHPSLLTLTYNRIRPGVAPLRPCPLWTGLGVRFQLDWLSGFAGMRIDDEAATFKAGQMVRWPALSTASGAASSMQTLMVEHPLGSP